METNIVQKYADLYNGSYPTYEEWKLLNIGRRMQVKFLRSYPTYEEWKLFRFFNKSKQFEVLILPMRNGNLLVAFFPNTSFYRSYPTYEEWKHLSFSSSSIPVSLVLILPMRNGNNTLTAPNIVFDTAFLSYL